MGWSFTTKRRYSNSGTFVHADMHLTRFLRGCVAGVSLLVAQSSFPGSNPNSDQLTGHLADYDAELRLPNGRVDVDTMVPRLKDLSVGTYYWLIWHATTDWDDLKLFLPKAAKVGLNVWVYLVPPSESTGGFTPIRNRSGTIISAGVRRLHNCRCSIPI